jgi:hypothetical protein
MPKNEDKASRASAFSQIFGEWFAEQPNSIFGRAEAFSKTLK